MLGKSGTNHLKNGRNNREEFSMEPAPVEAKITIPTQKRTGNHRFKIKQKPFKSSSMWAKCE